MRSRLAGSDYRASSAVAALALFFAIYASAAFGFYWLMQPTKVPNGVASYQPPPKTVMSDVPWVPPPPDAPLEITRAPREIDEGARVSAVAPSAKAEVKPQTPAVPRREYRARAQAVPQRSYTTGQSFGFFRPWF
jgi:hypothetical protein